MNEEEKKAIEYWKDYMSILHWNTQLTSEHYMKILLDLIEKLQKENEELKNKNIRLRNIRNEYKYGIENTHLITESDLVQIDINKYMIEIENGRFVDLKQVYQENIKLKKNNEKLKEKLLDTLERAKSN